jgi:hypothetical protein
MKNMRKLLYIALPVIILAACTKHIDHFNEETKKPLAVPGPMLFSNAVKSISDGMQNASVNINVFRFTVKHWAMAVYQDEAQYDFTTRAIPQSWWTRMYRDALADLNEASKIISADAFLDPGVKQNQLAIIDLMQVYAYGILVNSFGNIPYKDALNSNIFFPTYDDAKTVYADLMKRLADDLSKLNTASLGFAASDDIIFGDASASTKTGAAGTVAKYIKFAATVQMKMGMVLADVDNAAAKTAVEAADAKAISSAAENALFKYLPNSPSYSPLYSDIVVGKRSDYVAAKDLMDPLIAMSDPRKSLFFSVNNSTDNAYVGGIVGKANTFSDVSKPASNVYAATAPYVFADYVETEFLRAEAIERGYNVAGTAEQHYNNAITASILFWGGSATDAATYLARPDVAYATAAGAWRQKIGFQKWIGLYSRPFEGWVELRRLDYPQLPLAVNAKSGFPNRFTYPANEQTLNGTNYTTASAAIGGDKVETKLFWDKF